MPYIGVSPFNGVRKKHTYTATASQTSFSGVGAEGITLSYKDSTFVDVFQNGVKLGEADYTSTSGTAIVLAQGASLNDIVEVIVYDVFSVADTVSKADGGTFDGNVTMGGTLDVTGVATATTFEPDGDTAAGDNAAIGYTAAEGLILTGQGSTNDVTIKNDADADVLEIPTGTTNVSVVGSVTTEGGDNLFRNSSGSSIVSIIAGTSNSSILKLGDTADFDVGQIEYNHSSNYLAIKTNDTERFRIDDNGHITKPNQSAFSVELTSEAENKTGNATGFQLGSLGSTERFDRNGDVSNFLFTAPVDGLYLISIMIMYDGFGSANSAFAQIQTSNRIYQCALYNPTNSSNVGVNHQIVATYLCDMDANDTAQPLLYINGAGSDSVDLQATETRMSGILVA